MSKGKKRLLLLIPFFLLTFILLNYQYKNLTASTKLTKIFTYPYNKINNTLSSLISKIGDYHAAVEENRRLKQEINNLILERQQFDEILQENKRLKELLDIKGHHANYVASAKVIGRGYDRLLHTLIIDKGAIHGIKKDMAVITPKGLAGKVYSVKEHYSEFLVLTDPNFSVSVRLQNSRHEGVLSGIGDKYCILKYIPPELDVVKNESVVTSGLDGIMPKGIPVGIVSHIEKEGTGFFQNIQILPFVTPREIEEVIILRR